jgi:P27 family predicted phage terminase small subunit
MKRAIPPAPENLTGGAKDLWIEITTAYDLDVGGLAILKAACECYMRVCQCQEIIAAEGLIQTDPRGKKTEHPATRVERDNKALMARLIGKLGLDLEPLNPGPGRQPR